jgi:hypothetical protein
VLDFYEFVVVSVGFVVIFVDGCGVCGGFFVDLEIFIGNLLFTFFLYANSEKVGCILVYNMD